jgi:hypothetical protein
MASKNPKNGFGLGDVTPARRRVLDELAENVTPIKVPLSKRPAR